MKALTAVAALLLGTAILLTGQGLQGVLLPVRATLEDFSTLSVGAMGGAYFLGFTLGCWRGVRLLRRAGHVRTFAAMTAVASAAPLLQGLWVNLGTWVLLRATTGFCFAVLYVVIESWLNERATNENRGTIFSAYILINMVVLAVGQQMLLLGDPMELDLFALTSIMVSLAAVPLLLSGQAPPEPVTEATIDFRALWNSSPVGAFGTLASGLNNGVFWALAAVFVTSYSDDPGHAAWFMTAVIAGGAASQWPLGWWSDRVDRRWVLVTLGALGVVVSGLAWWFGPDLDLSGLLWLGFAWGALAFPIYSIAVAHANDCAAPGTFVQVSASLLLLYGVGAVIGPLLAPGFMDVLGPSGMYLYNALVFAVMTAYVLWRMRHRMRPDVHEQNFGEALTAAVTVSTAYEQEIEANGEHVPTATPTDTE